MNRYFSQFSVTCWAFQEELQTVEFHYHAQSRTPICFLGNRQTLFELAAGFEFSLANPAGIENSSRVSREMNFRLNQLGVRDNGVRDNGARVSGVLLFTAFGVHNTAAQITADFITVSDAILALETRSHRGFTAGRS